MKLHIANGDAIVPELEERDLEGVILPWGEALVAGPVGGPLANEHFWNVRKAFVGSAYGASAESYEKDIIEQFMKIVHVGSWNNIVLWFDRDLFCVVNATFLLYHLRPSHAMGASITWMLDGGIHDELKDVHWDATLGGHALGVRSLGGTSIELTRDDLAYAAQMWRAYAGPEPRDLETLINNEDPGQLSFVRDAYALHLQRFPSVDSSHSPLEQTLLSIDDPDPVNYFLRECNEGYGFGDTQLQAMLDELHSTSKSPIQLGGYTPGVQGAEVRWDSEKRMLVEV